MMGLYEAKRVCPQLVIVDGSDLTPFRNSTAEIEALIKETLGSLAVVERVVLDEFFLDLTQCVAAETDAVSDAWPGYVWAPADGEASTGGDDAGAATTSATSAPASQWTAQDGRPVHDKCGCGCAERLWRAARITARVRAAIFDRLGYTTCGGVGVNKLNAKLASAVNKPNKQTTLFPWHAPVFLLSQHVDAIQGVGHATTAKLKDIGVETVADLLKRPHAILAATLGDEFAAQVRRWAQGLDDTPVKVLGPPRTIRCVRPISLLC